MRSWLVGVVALCGCNQIFGLDDLDEESGCGIHDEDDDGVLDGCDNCPGVANTDQTDATEVMSPGAAADGVGDSCDPRPTQGGDRIVRFYTFAEPDANLDWIADSVGGWTFDGEQLVFEPAASGTSVLFEALPAPATPIAIELVGRIDAIPEAEVQGYLAIRLGATGDPNDGFDCGLARFIEQPEDFVLASYPDNINATGSAAPLSRVVAGDPVYLLMVFDGRVVTCTGFARGEFRTATLELDPAPVAAKLTLAGAGFSFAIDSMTIYGQ